jgi:hypothetical protein
MMAKADIAQQWLKANDPKANAPTRAQMRKGNKQHLVAMARARIAPVFYHALDEKAHNLLLQNEAKTRKNGRFCVMTFINESQGFDRDECLFVPFHMDGDPVCITFHGKKRTAANVMLILTQGWPQGDAKHARHKCGNGHRSCVNKKHLCWGTAEHNSADFVLHTAKPAAMPNLKREVIDAVANDSRLPNVIAVDYGVPAAIVQVIQKRQT